jgi:hypothetical protein
MAYLLIGPGEVLDYSFDWSGEVTGLATIATSTFTSSPSGLIFEGGAINNTGKKTTVTVSGAVAGKVYEVVNQITDSASRTLNQSFALRCHPR